jgi:hypothetical protein
MATPPVAAFAKNAGQDGAGPWRGRRINVAVTTNEVLGVVRPDGSLELTGKLTVPPGPVRVRVEALEVSGLPPAEGLVDFVRRTRRELEAAGHRFRTREEIDAELGELRAEWDDRLDELDRLRERRADGG